MTTFLCTTTRIMREPKSDWFQPSQLHFLFLSTKSSAVAVDNHVIVCKLARHSPNVFMRWKVKKTSLPRRKFAYRSEGQKKQKNETMNTTHAWQFDQKHVGFQRFAPPQARARKQRASRQINIATPGASWPASHPPSLAGSTLRSPPRRSRHSCQ